MTDNLGARDAAEGIEMERISREFVERIRAEREGRTAGTGQYVLGLR